jgi:hypothetical protein
VLRAGQLLLRVGGGVACRVGGWVMVWLVFSGECWPSYELPCFSEWLSRCPSVTNLHIGPEIAGAALQVLLRCLRLAATLQQLPAVVGVVASVL